LKEIRKITVVLIVFALLSPLSTVTAYAEDQKPATEAPGAAPAAAPAAAAAPAEDKITGSASLAVLNRYIFRGHELGGHSVVIQPQLSASYKGFTATLWSNIDTNEHATDSFSPDRPGQKSFNETDLTLSYTYNIDKLSLTGGYIYYGTKYADETEELFVSGTYDMIAHPALSVYRDIGRYPGTYINLSFSQSIPVVKIFSGDATIDLGAGFGYEIGSSNFWDTYSTATHSYTGSKFSAPQDGHVQVGFTMPVTKIFSVQPVAQYWFPLSGDANRVVNDQGHGSFPFNPDGHLREVFVYGLNATLTF
jgi:hypothetical protein